MKISGNEVLWLSEKANVAVVYAQFDMGAKYKVLQKVKYEREDGGYNDHWEFSIAFGTYGEAFNYARKMNDLDVFR